MRFVEAVCANCGAILSLQAELKTAFCNHCGSKILVGEAIERLKVLHPERVQADDQAAPQDAQQQTAKQEAPPEEEPPTLTAEEITLKNMFEEAENHLTAREYAQAAEIYTDIVENKSPDDHRAWWGLFRCDERNFNFEEKILQTFSCFSFCGGSEKMRRDIMDCRYLQAALRTAPSHESQEYFDTAKRHAERLFTYYSEGVNNLNHILSRRFTMLCESWETLGIVCTASRTDLPTTIPVRYMGEKKYYFRFSANRQGVLHLDVIHAWPDGESGLVMEHFRHLRLDPEKGALPWAEYRRFAHIEDLEFTTSEFDMYQKSGYALCGLWHDRLIIRYGTSIYYCRACVLPDQINEELNHCYDLYSVPIVEDPNSYNAGKKVSEFYHVQPIREVYETNQKSRWLKRHKGCYIATAVYGDYDAPPVLALRRYRDEVLCRRFWGRALILVYYTLSPPLARFMTGKEYINKHVRKGLDWFIQRL